LEWSDEWLWFKEYLERCSEESEWSKSNEEEECKTYDEEPEGLGF